MFPAKTRADFAVLTVLPFLHTCTVRLKLSWMPPSPKIVTGSMFFFTEQKARYFLLHG